MSPDEDLALRRELLSRAIERAWEVDLAETVPPGGFRLPPLPSPGLAAKAQPGAGLAGAKATALTEAYRTGELSPVDVATQALDQAEASQPSLNAFITILRDSALDQARASEGRWRGGQPLGPLDGVPVAVKDLIHIAGVPTTSASKVMAGFVATADAPVIQRLKGVGAVLVGKTNLHEFAYGGTGDVSAYGPSRNPHNLEHVTGGSSSGSGAAVAVGICPIALGTDTGGSIRIPAALCGVVGLKATYGRVPTSGVIPLSWSLDHVGPLAATVADAALALAALSDFELPDLDAVPSRPRVGLCRELFFQRLEGEVRQIVEKTAHDLGEVHEVDIPHISLASQAFALIIGSEARSFHKHWLTTRPEDYDWRVRNRLEAAAEISSADYVQATRLRAMLIGEMAAAMEGLDVLAMPTVAVPAPKIGQTELELDDGPADVTAVMVRNTGPISFTGFPAISVPCGNTAAGLPVGLMLVAPPWREDRLLQIAHLAESKLTAA